MGDILEHGKGMFFPNSSSPKGQISEFEFHVCDFAKRLVPMEDTVDHIIRTNHVAHLRLYIATKSIASDEIGSPHNKRKRENPVPTATISSPNLAPSTSGAAVRCCDTDGFHSAPTVGNPVTTEISGSRSESSENLPSSAGKPRTPDVSLKSIDNIVLHSPPAACPVATEVTPSLSESHDDVPSSAGTPRTSDVRPRHIMGSDLVAQCMESAGIIDAMDYLSDLTEDEIFFNLKEDTAVPITGAASGAPPSAYIPPVESPSSTTVEVIRVHRGRVFHDLIEYHIIHGLNPKVTYEFKVINPYGREEQAEDGGGVMRDVLTEFWETFYDSCKGSLVKVPVIRHDMPESRWDAVARVITLGYTQEKIFPVLLAKPFIESCLGMPASDLMGDFLKHIPEVDRTIIEEALKDINEVDSDELFDVLERHEVKVIVNADNINRVICEVAHKELVQAPSFVSKCWQPALRDLNISTDELNSIYIKLVPTTRKVLKSLSYPKEMDGEGRILSKMLKDFVRELDSPYLGLFLRFCTGSDLMIFEDITVHIYHYDGPEVSKPPTSHTCGCILEIPKRYAKEDYITFKCEFMALLRSRFFEMDII